ncbi:hypothetical protein CSUI_006355 [Cystoisospora suis]|uniref:Uncharacterized protein n=1 Tax=Cystoisospora suis TaxID=483139 RepID=A0A2C6KUE6_9APIC|nr:hypothetical protein CSUI_006355 [Cystoisospora suis]
MLTVPAPTRKTDKALQVNAIPQDIKSQAVRLTKPVRFASWPIHGLA